MLSDEQLQRTEDRKDSLTKAHMTEMQNTCELMRTEAQVRLFNAFPCPDTEVNVICLLSACPWRTSVPPPRGDGEPEENN